MLLALMLCAGCSRNLEGEDAGAAPTTLHSLTLTIGEFIPMGTAGMTPLPGGDIKT